MDLFDFQLALRFLLAIQFLVFSFQFSVPMSFQLLKTENYLLKTVYWRLSVALAR
jgi:hypothetical protein